MNTLNLRESLIAIQQAVPRCLAVGLVEVNTGMLLGVRTLNNHPEDVLDLVAAATRELFEGRPCSAIQTAFGIPPQAEAERRHAVREVILVSDNLLHVFQRCKQADGLVLVVVCSISSSLGMVLNKARGCLGIVEAGAS